jgi:hypothetical protein
LINTTSSYGIRENIYYTFNERKGDYKNLQGRLSATYGNSNDPFKINLYLFDSNKRYKTTKTSSGALRRENVVYWGGELVIVPLKWADLSCGYYKTHRTSNEEIDTYAFDSYKVYLKLTITFPVIHELKSKKAYFEIDPESII